MRYGFRQAVDDLIKSFACDICDKRFKQKKYLESHTKEVHQNKKLDPFRCDSCEKVFSAAGSLKRHVKTVHENIRNHTCVSCGKSFAMRENLEKHVSFITSKNHYARGSF